MVVGSNPTLTTYVSFEHWQAPLAVNEAPMGLSGSTPLRHTLWPGMLIGSAAVLKTLWMWVRIPLRLLCVD